MAAAFCRTPDGIHFTRQRGGQPKNRAEPGTQNIFTGKSKKLSPRNPNTFHVEGTGRPKNRTEPGTVNTQLLKILFGKFQSDIMRDF